MFYLKYKKKKKKELRDEKRQLLLLFSLFLVLFMSLIAPLVLFIGHTILFQLVFIFIYNTFDKIFSVSTK